MNKPNSSVDEIIFPGPNEFKLCASKAKGHRFDPWLRELDPRCHSAPYQQQTHRCGEQSSTFARGKECMGAQNEYQIDMVTNTEDIFGRNKSKNNSQNLHR